jgi:molybdopterin-guanine dinucleotide biosynthesis protein MobB
VFRFGIDRLAEAPEMLAGLRVGLLSHPAGVTTRLEDSWRVLRKLPGVRLVRLFGPEHGIDGRAQDMVSVGDETHPETGLPVRSLYGKSRESLAPSAADLSELDVLVCDLQDVGSRYYTFVWTICLALEACARAGKRVVVCDRPNPLGGAREGEPQREGFLSFVGLGPVPVRHGLTAGEIARLYAERNRLDVDLRVVPMAGWARSVGWPADLAWVPPSPNMPSADTAFVYPGACLVEATNLSEGRGTTRPFEQVGAPFLDAARLAERLNAAGLPGVFFRPVHFLPAFHKHAGKTCHGVFLHVTDRGAFRPYETGIRLLEAAREEAPGKFSWRREAYEFEDRPAIDLLTGSPELRELVDGGGDLSEYCARQRAVEFDPGGAPIYPDARPVLVGIAGAHDSGKTTLLEGLVPRLRSKGLAVGSIKHTPHEIEDDVAGKDSRRHREAGANPSAFVRPSAITVRRREVEDPARTASREFGECDIVLVEGFKSLPLEKIFVGRRARYSVEFAGGDYTGDPDRLARDIVARFRLGSV